MEKEGPQIICLRWRDSVFTVRMEGTRRGREDSRAGIIDRVRIWRRCVCGRGDIGSAVITDRQIQLFLMK